MSRLFWIVLALIGGGLILLVLNHDAGTTLGLPNDTFASTVYFGVWALVVAAAISGSRFPLGQIARNMALWILVILLLVAGYQYRYELQDVANRITAGLVPGSPMSISLEGGHAVMLEKHPSGHFEVQASVNGAVIRFIVDTGATRTVLTESDASSAGIDTHGLAYGIPVMTANGEARAASAMIRELQLGSITRQNLPVLVTPPGQLEQSLLGMNFLGTLSGFDVRGDRLILRD